MVRFTAAIGDALKDALGFIWDAISDKVFKPFSEKMRDFARATIPDELPDIKDVEKAISALDRAIKEKTGGVVDLPLEELWKLLIKPIFSLYNDPQPLTPDEALKTAQLLMVVFLFCDFAEWVTNVVGEVATLGQVESLGDLLKALSRRFGFGGISTMVQRAPFEMGVIRPLSYKLHEMFRNVIPSVDSAAEFYMKGDLEAAFRELKAEGVRQIAITGQSIDEVINDPTKYLEKMAAFRGWTPEFYKAWLKGIWREPRYFELSMMLEERAADRDWLVKKLQRAFYDPQDREIMADALIKRYLGRYMRGVRSRALLLYKEGLMTDDEFEKILRDELDMPQPAIDLAKREADLYYEYDYKMDLLRTYEDLYRKDVISDEEFESEVRKIIKVEEKARAFINRVRAKKKLPPIS